MAKRMTGGPKQKKAKKMKVIKGDTVKVITGNDKGKEGKVLKTFPDNLHAHKASRYRSGHHR